MLYAYICEEESGAGGVLLYSNPLAPRESLIWLLANFVFVFVLSLALPDWMFFLSLRGSRIGGGNFYIT